MATLCERLGGQEAIEAVVEEFYNNMLKDDRVKDFFAQTDMQKQKKKQAAFLTMLTGGPNQYDGGQMKAVHQKMAIGHLEFDATWENLQKALKTFEVKEQQIDEVKKTFYSAEDQIVTKK